MQNLAKELVRLAGDLESHLDDNDLTNLHGLMGHVVCRLLEVAEEITAEDQARLDVTR